MGEVIYYDFSGEKGVIDRQHLWPEVRSQTELIDQAKNIYTALMLTDESTPEEILDRLTVNLENCLRDLGPQNGKLIDEIYIEAAKNAKKLRKEII